jgi:ectoine hydroxylase-related dioxygenase (phytanoyl-CoA dioxygenase family)
MTLPSLRISDSEQTFNRLDPATRLLLSQVFANKGVLTIENAFAPDFVLSLKNALMNEHGGHLLDRETDETLVVGDRRIMVPLEINGQFNKPQLSANPLIFPLLQDILGAECILGGFGAVTALPGADDQHIHRDHPFLFHDQVIDTLVPAYAVNLILPLVDCNEHHGTTRVWPGSHRVWLDREARKLPSEAPIVNVGSCILMDYRLVHGGTANQSKQARPILYLLYQRPWFRDNVNVPKVKVCDG